MSGKNSFWSLNRIIGFLIAFLVLILFSIFVYKFAGGLTFLVQDSATQKSAFHTYDVKKNFGQGSKTSFLEGKIFSYQS